MISLPMPTVAAINGHAAAAGFTFALSHDYVLMRRDKGVLYMSEVDIGLTLANYFSALFLAKIGSASVRRDILLRAMKIRGEEAVKMGIVDSAHDSVEHVVEASMFLGKRLASRKWSGEVGLCGDKEEFVSGNMWRSGIGWKTVVANPKL